MARVNEAWRVLSEPSRRAVYDRALHDAAARTRHAVSGRSTHRSGDMPHDAFDDDDDGPLTGATGAVRYFARALAITSVGLALLALAFFVYAFSRSPTGA
jgi:DnaJ-class molecular chaperone